MGEAAYEERFAVRWSDLDANRHLRNTVFSEYATHTRLILRADDRKQAAVSTIDGAWIHLDDRKLVVPPQELVEIFGRLPRTSEFEELRSVIRR